MTVRSIHQHNFQQEVMQSSTPVLVDFWAPWCMPCRMFAPILEQVAAEQQGNVKVVKVNIDEEPELAMQFGVMSIPTLMVVKDGAVVASSTGVQPKQNVERLISA